MSNYDITPSPAQQFRSPLGLPEGSSGPLGAPLPEPPPTIDIAPPYFSPAFPPPGDTESDVLKSIIVAIGDYKRMPTVTEQDRAQIGKAEQIVQRLLAANEKLSDRASGIPASLNKLVSGAL